MIYTSIDALVTSAKLQAARGLYDGRVTQRSKNLIAACTHIFHERRRGVCVVVIFTRDIGHHSSGWWKNPDYERCFHLSLSVKTPFTLQPLPAEKEAFEELAAAFFGAYTRKCWIEGPYSPEGKASDVWHYRLFCNQSWAPILPRGEVYSREFTEAGWRSFSDIHGRAAFEQADAPFLKGAQ